MIEISVIILIGLFIGAYGTIIGAGGGFILMPILLLIYPQKSADVLTSISLAVIFFNAASGTAAYIKMKRVDFKAGLIFAAATIPGAILGAYIISYINRFIFNLIFGFLLIGAAIYLYFRPLKFIDKEKVYPASYYKSELTDAQGTKHIYYYNLKLGVFISIFVGFLSTMLGIGGGIIHVPTMVNLLNFPVHIATATSHFVLAIMALSGTIVHLINGTLEKEFWEKTLVLAAGVIIGAQFGAKVSGKLESKWIIRALSVALGIVGIRILTTVIR